MITRASNSNSLNTKAITNSDIGTHQTNSAQLFNRLQIQALRSSPNIIKTLHGYPTRASRLAQ